MSLTSIILLVVSMSSGASSYSVRRKWRTIAIDDEALTILAWYKYAYRLKTYSDAVRLMHSLIARCGESVGAGKQGE
ncbi:hypothetical protein DKAM_1128 [Desulfurococcus amylolyticus 1221n]|uniref:Uncharacterized protein n=1 Tax=Desulfurococcus amylolyticus (strain DSM 18924 / JCM 16383 / VKM B-2413 / 1221n) TaxID=490899 RepID=B8D5S3_DESA1|nr:hypothetical protein [Desulfurococcus amylolyticus]ACL11454.1 hypothetical protein DKAM_1128 [Desulfurococcus amylolyticus 1221n]